MIEIDVKHWYSVEKIIDALKEDQKKALTANSDPVEIAKYIQAQEEAIVNLKRVLETWKEDHGYPNVSNLKYIYRH